MKLFFRVILPCAILAYLAWLYLPWFASGDDAAQALVADAGQLSRTVVSSHLETPLPEGKNVLWCGTFQLAWNEVCRLAGEDLHFSANEPPDVAILNGKDFTRDEIDEPSYLAVADFVKNNVHDRIRQEMRKKFPGETPRFIPSESLTPRPQDIVAYAFLRKNLEFPQPFERLTDPILFAGTEVPGFGIGKQWKPDHPKLYPQVSVLYFRDADDFAVELKTKSAGDRLMLAKLRAERTLRATIERVLKQAATEPDTAALGDVLMVPRLDFDLTRQFGELHGHLVFSNPKLPKDLRILSALQNVRFEMNEKGVKLRSEAHLAIGCSAEHKPKPARLMICDAQAAVRPHHGSDLATQVHRPFGPYDDRRFGRAGGAPGRGAGGHLGGGRAGPRPSCGWCPAVGGLPGLGVAGVPLR